MKTFIGQINPIVGDLEGNARKIMDAYAEGREQGADIVILPECVLTGYPLEDLVLRESFLRECENQNNIIYDFVYGFTDGPTLVYGTPRIFPVQLRDQVTKLIRNSAYVLRDAEGYDWIIDKVELPNYGVFDELRTFNMAERAGRVFPVKTAEGVVKVGAMICEDCWHPNVSQELHQAGADILVAINGSPYEIGKNVTRHDVVRDKVWLTGLPFIYVNMVGGQDELVFDGGSFAYDGQTHQAPYFETANLMWDIAHQLPQREEGWFPAPEPNGIASIYRACVLGLRDYMEKNGFQSVVLGYSGGVDSGLVAALACDAIGAERVNLVRLPSNFSSDGSLTDAQEGADRLGALMRTIRIEPVVEALRMAYRKQEPYRASVPRLYELEGVADENIQARARGNILMAISNQENHLLLSTGNRTEVSVGYATLYGDMSGGFNPIKDCYKTTVWEMCRWRNALTEEQIDQMGFRGRATEVVPESIIVKPPSAELRPDQKDSDSLPPYEILDDILKLMLEREMSVEEMVTHKGPHDVEFETERKTRNLIERVRKLVDRNEYKRRQACPGVKITAKSFGRDRRYPITNWWSR